MSGWMMLNLPDVRHGDIILKIETWHQSGSAWRTADWTTINNEKPPVVTNSSESGATSPAATNSTRFLKKKKPPPPLCDKFQFQYSIDGKITSLDVNAFKRRKIDLARVVEVVPILSDPEYTGGVEKQVEVGLRIIGCDRKNTFKLTHVYWT